MKKIIAGLFISLDGVIESPENWHFPYFNDEMGAAVGSQIEEADTMLLGRRTFEDFAEYWPQQSSDVPYADFINNTPKYVVSSTLESVEWQNSTIIGTNVADEVRRLKEQPGKNIGMTGSPTLVRWLLHEGLLDELRLLVHPIVVGSGKRLFVEGEGTVGLKLLNSQTFANGVLNLTYCRADA